MSASKKIRGRVRIELSSSAVSTPCKPCDAEGRKRRGPNAGHKIFFSAYSDLLCNFSLFGRCVYGDSQATASVLQMLLFRTDSVDIFERISAKL